AGDASRSDSPLLSARERRSSGALGQAQVAASALTELEQALVAPGADVNGAVSALFGAATALAGVPLDSSLRQDLLANAAALAQALHTSSSAVSQARSDANSRIADDGKEATRLAAQIAAANKALAQGPDPALADQRDLAAKQLAGIVGGSARIDGDGMMRV